MRFYKAFRKGWKKARQKDLIAYAEHCQLDAPESIGRLAWGVITGRVSPLDDNRAKAFPGTQKWARTCYHNPSKLDTKLEALNELFNGFGIEHTGPVQLRDGPPMLYVNQGDSYAGTIIWDDETQSWYVGYSWGDWVEMWENTKAGKDWERNGRNYQD